MNNDPGPTPSRALRRFLACSSLILVAVPACKGCDTGGGRGGVGRTSAGAAACNFAFVEKPACKDCIGRTCPQQMVDCYGPQWSKDLGGGPCGGYGACLCSCPKDDAHCLDGCNDKLDS